MKVLGLISSLNDPASRVRIIQYQDELRINKIELKPRFYTPEALAEPNKNDFRLNKISGINESRILRIRKIIKRLPLFYEQYRFNLIWQSRMILPYYTFFDKYITTPRVFDFD
ncbi:MAG: hypothetical protein ABIP79_11090, partial [Chitinophagaceae bacterium]